MDRERTDGIVLSDTETTEPGEVYNQTDYVTSECILWSNIKLCCRAGCIFNLDYFFWRTS